MTAVQVAGHLADAGLPLAVAVVFTAEHDPGGLLGRCGGYTGKVVFTDPRAAPAVPGHGGTVEYSAAHGGSVEVYADGAAAAAQAGHAWSLARGSPGLFGEYTFTRGVVVLRVSRLLTPKQAGAYEAALTSLPG